MISRNSGGGFFAAHWDWIVAAAGVVALVGGVVLFTMSGNGDPEENAANVVRRLKSAKRADTGVKPVDMSTYERALQFAVKPLQIAEVEETGGNFLVSERRVFCKSCKKPIKDGSKTCPFCGEAQPEPEKVVVDSDGDGLPDWWEEKYGLDVTQNDADADKDGDGFTNAEEYAAGTDPADRNSHPDYLDSLKLVLPLKETVLPFYLRSYMKTPAGMKLEFFDPKRRNDYGKNGYRYYVLVGEAIGDTGFMGSISVLRGVMRDGAVGCGGSTSLTTVGLTSGIGLGGGALAAGAAATGSSVKSNEAISMRPQRMESPFSIFSGASIFTRLRYVPLVLPRSSTYHPPSL